VAANRKLSAVIGGRSVVSVGAGGHDGRDESTAVIRFDDGSTMTVRTAPGTRTPAATGKILKVRQSPTALQLDFDDGRTLELATAEPASSVILRGPDGTLRYAD
jgi:hypothetical protein